MQLQHTTGILLAGGLSRRYGSPKAFAKINGSYFYEQAYKLLEETCQHVVIVTRHEFVDWFPTDYHVIVDVEAYRGCGPLAGIYSGMESMESNTYVVLPCDMPLLEKESLQRLYSLHLLDVTVVDVQGKLQPLVSIWDQQMKQRIEKALDYGQYKMTDVLDQCRVTKIGAHQLTNDVQTFMNINSSEEDKEMRKWLRS